MTTTFQQLKKAARHAAADLPAIKVALLGDTATQLLATAISGTLAMRGYRAELYEADYNQIEMQMLNPDSEYHASGARYTVVFQSTHRLLGLYNSLDRAAQERLADDRMAQIEALAAACDGKMIYLDYPETADNVFGSFGTRVRHSFVYQLRRLNYLLGEFAATHPDFYICDIADVQNRIGRSAMFDANIYNSTEMVLSLGSLPYVAARIADIITALQGRARKCVILDLDNTLWGGVVGDDGWQGIQIGIGMGIGKAFSEFQAWLRQLKNRGIILAVCSKNNEATAKEPFEKNPEMVLSLDDIAMFVANWDNKADNIRHIQQTLNIGFDSMVFIDDNPFERNIVRENIDGITVPEMPEDPADWLEFLYGLNLFEAAAYSEADSDRTRQYQVEARRSADHRRFADEDQYLQSLDMRAGVAGFDDFNTPRVAQLSQRSNQWNLRTVRYDEADIHRIAADGLHACFAFTLADKYGDNGLISVVILDKNDERRRLFVDTWFMSCRVLKRGMEQFVLNTVVDYARANGYREIEGEYIATPKNSLVADLYPSLGFEPAPGREGRYILDVDRYEPLKTHITINKH
ncbi:MAG: HAD-IIIC family phosphatase [Bacteroidales bacterium]|nr:HAD-IIIC family phosphatase [Bacteroidales bacterium]